MRFPSPGLFLLIPLAASLAAVPVQSFAQARGVFEQECGASFEALDSDHNQGITIQEFVVGSGAKTYETRRVFKDRFVVLDSNGNGIVTREEFCIPPPETDLSPEEQCVERFQKMDGDKNGKLSLTEWMDGEAAQSYATRKVIKNTLLTKDLDGDKMLTPKELCAPE